MKIVVGLPAYNEEMNIARIIVQLKKITNTIIVCDDGSSDLTASIAEEVGAVVVRHPKNLGYGAAIKTIFLKAKEIDADILVTFDADGQHNPKDIEKILEPIKDGKADIAIGSRFLNNSNKIPEYRKIGIKAITSLTNTSTGSKITDAQSGFRAYNKKAIHEIHISDSGMGVSTEILIKASKQKLVITEVPITVLYDKDTSTHHPVSHGSSVILSTLKFISIENPLRFYGIPGIIFLVVGLTFMVWTLQEFSKSGEIITNLTLIGIGTIVLGTVLLITAVILFSIISVVRERS